MIVIAHRGASGYAPEHTFAAWDLALEMGADYIEQDLQMTADGVLVVMHDESLGRTARGAGCVGPVRRRTWAEIAACDVGSWFNEDRPERARPEFAGLTLPRLADVFERYHGHARFYIETKKPKSAPGMEMELLRLMAEFGLRPTHAGDDRVIIQSFSPASLRIIHQADPLIPLVRLFAHFETGFTLRRRLPSVPRYATGIGPAFDDVNEKLMVAARRLGLVVHPWTVNRDVDMRRLMSLGVDGMFTDFPDVLVGLRAGPDALPAD